MKQDVKTWLKENKTEREFNIKNMELKLDDIEGNMETRSIPVMDIHKEEETFKTFHRSLTKEEEYSRLKLRNTSLKVGDRNTKFLHKQANFFESNKNIT